MSLGKKVQGALPIVGLISRLTSPEGGFDAQTYPEFARTWLEVGSDQLNCAMEELEARHGRLAGRRIIFLLLWMIQKGLGLLPPTYFVLSARRLRASLDVQAEMERFEQALEAEALSYKFLEPTPVAPATQLEVAVDSIATCCLGLRDGMEIGSQDQDDVVSILTVVFPKTSVDQVVDVIKSRKSRQAAYSTI